MELTSCDKTALDILKIFGPALLSAGVAYMLFWLKVQNDRDNDEEKAEKVRVSKVKYLTYISEEAIKVAEGQIKGVNEHIALVEKERFVSVPLAYYNRRSCEILIELISSEVTFTAFVKSKFKDIEDNAYAFSQVSAKGIFINELMENIMKGTKDNFDYIQKQTREAQLQIDALLAPMNRVSIDIQTRGASSEEDNFYVQSVKDLDDRLHAQESQGLETFYNYLVAPLQDILKHCSTKRFFNINALLDIARERDRAERLYNELFGSRDIYLKTLNEELAKLKQETQKFKDLISSLK